MTIDKALSIWLDTKREYWAMRGRAAVHKDASVSVNDGNLECGYIRLGRLA